jgi:hypothetical protein
VDIIEKSAEALKPISDDGIIVRQGWYEESLKQLHVTLWNLSDYIAAHSDDDEEVEAGMVQVNIWSAEDQVSLKKRIKKLMRGAGFRFVEGHDELETDTRVFINAMRFLLVQEAENESEV